MSNRLITKQLGVHFALFLGASALAWGAASRPKDDRKPLEVDLWSAKPADIKHVHYKSAKREVELAPQHDARGAFWIGKVTKILDASLPPAMPPQPKAATTAEGATEGATTVVAPEPAPPTQPTTEVEQFVGVKEASELIDQLAKLRALRSLGQVNAERLTEFGLTGGETADLTIDVGGTPHTMTLGGRTPGGGDVYAQDKQSGAVYVIGGDLTKDIELADNRLMERELLTPPEEKEVGKVVLSHGDKARSVVHSTEHPSSWTDEAAPADKNETLTNWMKKFERLRATGYVEGQPAGLEPLVVAKFSTQAGEALGEVELAKQTLPGEAQPRYLARSPQTRWWAVVLASTGSELAADLPSVLE